jgi:hypothetical protein
MPNVPTTRSTARPSGSPDGPPLIDLLFQRFATLYGSRWLDMWRGIPVDQVKATWSDLLVGCTAEDVRRALTHVQTHNPYPPSGPEFAMLVRQLRLPAGPALPPPWPSLDEVDPEVLAKVRAFARNKGAA